MAINPALANILSDLFINLAAGWLGTVIIVPIAIEGSRKEKLMVLTWHIILAILSLVVAFELKVKSDI